MRCQAALLLAGAQMPAMRTVLTEEQIRDVSDYVAAELPPEAP
jgi:mono/diheme cytochrome c family protein